MPVLVNRLKKSYVKKELRADQLLSNWDIKTACTTGKYIEN